MRFAAPYPRDHGPDIVRHRRLGGRHDGSHETPHHGGAHASRRARRVVSFVALVVVVALVPVAAWVVLLVGVGLPADAPTRPAATVSPPVDRLDAAPPTDGLVTAPPQPPTGPATSRRPPAVQAPKTHAPPKPASPSCMPVPKRKPKP